MKIKIGELAQRTGCQVVTLRYYEKEGLLRQPERTEGNYRLYSEEDVERVRFILCCRRHNMTLSEIRELLAFRDNPGRSCSWIGSLVEKHIAEVNDQIVSLVHLKEHLESLLQSCADKNGGCGILAQLEKGVSCPYCENLRCLSDKVEQTHFTDSRPGKKSVRHE